MGTTYNVASGKKIYKDNASSADTYIIDADATSFTLAGKINGDIIALEGLASDYTVKATGRTFTLTNTDGQKIRFQMATLGSATIEFFDGALTATWSGKVAMLGMQKIGT